MGLAIFDLDNTLLGGDSDYLWGQYLAETGIVNGAHYERENQRYYAQYVAGTLDIHKYLEFALQPIAGVPLPQLHAWRAHFVQTKIAPIVLPKALALIARHREAGDTLLIITATNRFVTAPIAELLQVPHLIATEAEMADGLYTGRVTGTPSFREGKVTRLEVWLREHGTPHGPSWFYSDSHNDLPLLQQVSHPVAVDPDPALRRHAEHHGWPVISLRP